jgi:hypothetical protein
VEDDEELQNLNTEEEEQLIASLEAHRKVLTRGARANNRSATLDASPTMLRIQQEVGLFCTQLLG